MAIKLAWVSAAAAVVAFMTLAVEAQSDTATLWGQVRTGLQKHWPLDAHEIGLSVRRLPSIHWTNKVSPRIPLRIL